MKVKLAGFAPPTPNWYASAAVDRRTLRRDAPPTESRKQGVKASSTVGVIAQLLTLPGSGIDRGLADTYLQTLQARKRMHAALSSIDLLAGDLGPWQ
jgi:hypothetical protein